MESIIANKGLLCPIWCTPHSNAQFRRFAGDKLRLDFNENTVGCSPAVIAALRQKLDAGTLAVYPEYSEAKEAIASYFHVRPDQFVAWDSDGDVTDADGIIRRAVGSHP